MRLRPVCLQVPTHPPSPLSKRRRWASHTLLVLLDRPVKILCGFLRRNNAEEALQSLNGTVIGKQTVRLSWGRNAANKQVDGLELLLLLLLLLRVNYYYSGLS